MYSLEKNKIIFNINLAFGNEAKYGSTSDSDEQ